jgi:hypothetical protein
VANDSGRTLTVAKGTNLAVNANTADATYQITIPNNAPIGPMSFHVQTTTQVDYSRNPEADQAVKDAQALLDTAKKEQAAVAKRITDAKNAAKPKRINVFVLGESIEYSREGEAPAEHDCVELLGRSLAFRRSETQGPS